MAMSTFSTYYCKISISKWLSIYYVHVLTLVKVTALDLLKIITSTKKVQIGPHISSDVVHLLFTVAEMGAESDSVFHR